MRMDKIVRVGVSFEPELLKAFDAHIAEKKYTNRSEAIRDLIRNELLRKETMDPASKVIGTINIVYDHHVPNLSGKLIHIQHDTEVNISTTTHIHLDSHLCFEVLVVEGRTADISALCDSLHALKGVEYAEKMVALKE